MMQFISNMWFYIIYIIGLLLDNSIERLRNVYVIVFNYP